MSDGEWSERVATAVGSGTLPSAEIVLPGPLDAAQSLEMFRRVGDDGLDRWDGTRLVRTLTRSERVVAYICEPAGSVAQPRLIVRAEEARDLPEVVRALHTTFIAAPPDYPALLAQDPALARLDARYWGLRQVRQFDLFAALVRCISAQQVNLRWAAVTRRRLAEAFGERHTIGDTWVYRLSVERLAVARVEDIRALQFTTRKAEYLIATARAIAGGSLAFDELDALDDDAVIERIIALRGLGRWTAEWILARSLGRPRVVAGDLAVRKAVGALYLGEPLPPEGAVRQATAHWGASAGVAQTLLLAAYAAGTLAT
ncbi:MAG: DNA-3-methyladenine glycosylase family protein [Ktedonobacterales bacterium]